MTHLATLQGSGSITIDGAPVGSAEYEIDVYKPRTLTEAHGTITAAPGVIGAIVGAKGATLALQSGGAIKILARRWTAGGRDAEITVSGPIPGY